MGKKWLLILALLFLPQLSLAQADLEISITKTRLDWRTWQFQPLGGGAIYLWDFGDREVSDAKEPTHAFPRPGRYRVTLSTSGAAGAADAAETEIVISFWHIQNIWLQAILGVLGVGVIALILLIIFNKLPKLKDE